MTETNIATAHAHITKASADCDGPFYQEYTVFVSDEAKAKSAAAGGVNDFWEIDFREGVLSSQISVYALTDGHTVKVTVTDDGFEWHETTDEGYRSGEVRWCDDETCGESYSQRDVYAELAGY